MRGQVLTAAVKRPVFVGLTLFLSAWLVLSLRSAGLACPELSYCYASVRIPLDPDALPSPCTGQTPLSSGTNCSAEGCAGAAEGCFITKVKLYVGGEEGPVNTYEYTGGPGVPHVQDRRSLVQYQLQQRRHCQRHGSGLGQREPAPLRHQYPLDEGCQHGVRTGE